MIVAISGHTEHEYIEKAWLSGIDEFISKPAQLKSLTHIINEII